MGKGRPLIPALLALGLTACGGGNSSDSGLPPFVTGPDAPFAIKPDPTLVLSLCKLPGGTIGAPEPENPAPAATGTTGMATAQDLPPPPDLPGQVALRTDTQTYNRLYQFALDNGRLWFKSNTAVTGIDQPWAAATLPACLVNTLIGISVDDDELIAVRADGAIYGMDNALKDASQFNWSSRWGPPLWLGNGYRLPPDYLAWSWSVISPTEDQHWTDPAGNLQTIGTFKVSHIWTLVGGGQRYRYNDPWLPKDQSYEMCGPARGRFRGVNLSASGSAIFTVNRFGDLYTRFYDFDLSGNDNLFFRYSYDDQRHVEKPAIQLPPFDWVQQPKIPGTITHNIAIHKVGVDMQHRILRVEGLDAQRHAGYWEKDIGDRNAADWHFTRTDQPLRGTILDNRPYDSTLDDAGPNEDAYYSRNMQQLGEIGQHPHVSGDGDWAAELTDFNVYCPPDRLRIWFSTTDPLDLILHTTDEIRQLPRARGLDDQPRSFEGDIEIPSDTWGQRDRLSAKAREFIHLYLKDQRNTAVHLSGVSGQITFKNWNWQFARQ